MSFRLEYHVVVKRPVQRSIPASFELIGMLLLPLLLVSSSPAQMSAASSGGGHASGGASVTSSGRSGFAPPTAGFAPPTAGFTPPTAGFRPPTAAGNSHHVFDNHGGQSTNRHYRHSAYGDVYYPYAYAVPVPYAVDNGEADNDDDSDYQGGPTVFDRRGSGVASYVPPSYEGPAHAEAAADEASQSAAAEPPQPVTTLVFKDGHQIEIANYAIVSQTLYDLTPGHPRRIALADLDLPATEKENDDNGVSFALPSSAQAN